jgi:hypothetical protein
MLFLSGDAHDAVGSMFQIELRLGPDTAVHKGFAR